MSHIIISKPYCYEGALGSSTKRPSLVSVVVRLMTCFPLMSLPCARVDGVKNDYLVDFGKAMEVGMCENVENRHFGVGLNVI